MNTLERASELAAAALDSQRREATFTIFADPYGPASELAGLRQSFTATSVTHGLSVDRRHGIVTLAPQGITLRVGSEADEYQRIRVVDHVMGIVGTMSCSSDGTVRWRAVADSGSQFIRPSVAICAAG